MRDIVERLRETIVAYDEWYQGRLKTSDTLVARFKNERHEAAEEITRLRAENEKLREALKPFAEILLTYVKNGELFSDDIEVGEFLKVSDLRAAAAAIRESE